MEMANTCILVHKDGDRKYFKYYDFVNLCRCFLQSYIYKVSE